MNDGIFFPDPGLKECYCEVCDTKMDVLRDCLDYTSWSGAMSKIKRKHDRFTCPYLSEKWHKQAAELFRLGKNTPSKLLQNMYEREAEGIIKVKRVTKDDWNNF